MARVSTAAGPGGGGRYLTSMSSRCFLGALKPPEVPPRIRYFRYLHAGQSKGTCEHGMRYESTSMMAAYLSSRSARTRRTSAGSTRQTLPVRPVLTPSSSRMPRSSAPVMFRYGPHPGASLRRRAGRSASFTRSSPSTWPRSTRRSRDSISSGALDLMEVPGATFAR